MFRDRIDFQLGLDWFPYLLWFPYAIHIVSLYIEVFPSFNTSSIHIFFHGIGAIPRLGRRHPYRGGPGGELQAAGLPSMTQVTFKDKEAVAARKGGTKKGLPIPLLYTCDTCEAKYESSNAYTQHLNSKAHRKKAAIKKHASMAMNTTKTAVVKRCRASSNGTGEVEEFSPLCCFLCDRKFAGIEHCMGHMQKMHDFFVPDAEYLKDPIGFFTYVGLMVTKEFRCLWCNERCLPFQSLEAIRKHMVDKGHCRVRYGDLNGSDEEDGNLEDFYDYSSSYMDGTGQQLVLANDLPINIALGSGSELVITRKTDKGISVKTFGSREYVRYYRQNPRPTPVKSKALTIATSDPRLRIMDLSALELNKKKLWPMTVLNKMRQHSVESMHTRIGMKKNNIVKQLPMHTKIGMKKNNIVKQRPRRVAH